jgi:hypothetical protein
MDRRIAYTRADGGVTVVTSVPWARMVSSALIDGERVAVDPPRPLDLAAGRPLGALDMQAMEPEWSESENDFLERVAAKAIPADATDIIVLDAADLPDRAMRHAWVIVKGKLIVDPNAERRLQYVDGSSSPDTPQARLDKMLDQHGLTRADLDAGRNL